MPQDEMTDMIEKAEAERKARFARTLEAIARASLEYDPDKQLSDEELDALIDRARKSNRQNR
jgi:hypothetical protein